MNELDREKGGKGEEVIEEEEEEEEEKAGVSWLCE